MIYAEDYIPVIKENGFNTKKNIKINQSGVFFQDNGVILPKYEYAQSAILTASSASQPLWTAPNDGSTYVVAGVSARFTAASSSGTLQVEVAGTGVAVASGTNQLTGTISLAGTANTTVNGTVIASPTSIAAGTSVNLILAGTLTSLAGCVVTVVMQRTA